MQTRIRKWGNSLAIRIPKAFAVEVELAQDVLVELALDDGRLTIVPVGEALPPLDDLLRRITPDNLHGETETASVVGREAW